jgi:Ni/Fe-hydrogenase subunit HybB-like protein
MSEQSNMVTREQWVEANKAAVERVPKIRVVLLAMVAIGALAFLGGLVREGTRDRVWQAYWINFLYWAGLAQAGVVLAALVQITRGRWGGAVVRLGLLQAAFLPVTIVLYFGIALGAGSLLPWVAHPVEGKEWWLNLPFFLVRDALALIALCVASVAFAYLTVRPEAGILREAGVGHYPAWLTRGWRGADAERERSRQILAWLAPLLVFLYCIVYTLVGFDMVMTLDPHWYSNLFGAYFFITTMYMGLAALIVAAAVVRRRLRLEAHFTSKQFHDLGMLLFGFCLLSADFLWSQFLVIWYGDLPEEIGFVLRRVRRQPDSIWWAFSYFVLLGGFVIPFVILINRRVKQIPTTLAAIALLVLVVGFCERLLMVLPSLHTEPDYTIPVGVIEGAISIGYAGLYGLALLWALRNAPIVPLERWKSSE